jgi:hypothetical protein
LVPAFLMRASRSRAGFVAGRVAADTRAVLAVFSQGRLDEHAPLADLHQAAAGRSTIRKSGASPSGSTAHRRPVSACFRRAKLHVFRHSALIWAVRRWTPWKPARGGASEKRAGREAGILTTALGRINAGRPAPATATDEPTPTSNAHAQHTLSGRDVDDTVQHCVLANGKQSRAENWMLCPARPFLEKVPTRVYRSLSVRRETRRPAAA